MGILHHNGTRFLPVAFNPALIFGSARRYVEVALPSGLNLRACAQFVETAECLGCSIHIRKGNVSVDGIGVLSVLSLGADTGTLLEISAHGPGASNALDFLAGLTTTEGVHLFSITAPGISGSGPIDGGSLS